MIVCVVAKKGWKVGSKTIIVLMGDISLLFIILDAAIFVAIVSILRRIYFLSANKNSHINCS